MIRILKQLLPLKLKVLLKKIRSTINRKRFSGDSFYCSVCESHLSSFMNTPIHVRPAKCPVCGSLERHRLLWDYFKSNKNLVHGEKIKLLHMAPEPFFYEKFSKMKNVEYYPCDLDPLRYPGKVYKEDINSLSFKEGAFDAILCNHVLEHIEDDRKAMGELHRVLKKSGWAILQVPINSPTDETYEDFSLTTAKERHEAFGQHDHVRKYGIDYKDRLKEAQFKVTEDAFIKSFDSELIEKNGYDSDEIIYLCRK